MKILSFTYNDNGIRKFSSENCGIIGFIFGSIFIITSLISIYRVTSNLIDDYLLKAKSFSDSASDSILSITKKIDFVIEIVASGMWTKYAFYTTGFLIISLITSVIVGIIMAGAVASENENLFLFTPRDNERKRTVEKRLSSNWLSVLSSIIGALIIGVAGNYIFSKMTQWFQL